MGARILNSLGFCLIFLSLQGQTFIGTKVELRNTAVLNQQFTNYEIFELNAAALDTYVRDQPQSMDLNLRLGTSINWELELTPVQMLSPDYRLRIATPSGIIEQTGQDEVLTFKGKIRGVDNSQVRITVNGNFIYGYVREGQHFQFIEPSDRFNSSAAANHYLVYNAMDVVPVEGISCGVTEMHENHIEPGHTDEGGSRVNDVYTELAIASDYLMYLMYGTVGDVTNHNVGVMNNVAGDYDGAVFNNDVNFVIVEQFVSTCATCDPWTDDTAAGTLLASFADWGSGGGFNASHDLGQLWTDRDLNGSTVGIAYVGAVCNANFKYQVLQDYTANATSLRVLTSHETGHNFGATHNYAIGSPCDPPGRTVLIMDPTVSNATNWSSGIELCVNKLNGSITEINNTLNAVSCLSAAVPGQGACMEVMDFAITNITATGISVSWTDPGLGSTFRVRTREEGAVGYLTNQSTNLNAITISPPLTLCETYEILVETDCGGGVYSAPVSALFETPSVTDFEITDLSTSNCTGGTPNGTYDLSLTFTHRGGNGSGFNVNVNGADYFFNFGASPQTETIIGLTGDGTLDNPVSIAAVTNGGGDCDASATYDEPDSACSLLISENFDDCQLPGGWIGTTTTPGFTNPFEWKVDGPSRPELNYGNFSIDGSCMTYFDDDVNSHPTFTGIATLTTEAVDLTPYENTVLSFIYNFHDFEDGKTLAENSGNSQFTVDVWDGSAWQNVVTDNDDVCIWNNVWLAACYETPVINVDAYRNANFQVRFTYTDGGDGSWAGMIAFDDYVLSGDLSAALPVDLLSFTGRPAEEGAQLNWSTATEVNAEYFELEHSLDGRHFEPVTQVAAAGNASTQKDYAFLHEKPVAGINYYRLNLYNFDGSMSHEGTVTVQFQKETNLAVIPNPVQHNTFSFIWNSGLDDHLEMTIFDVTGHLVLSQKHAVSSGVNQLQVQNLDLPAGLYLLRVFQGAQGQTARFVVE
ncbi:MAG: hypothetical protein DHS20C18_28340 [Saprospiraceae bacterium]|nr:MAG: hypothetical protein DHS20C18_28340 [Saprospiraceae bacterium]